MQYVVLYVAADGDERVYDSAYRPMDVRAAIVRCVERHGRHARVRSARADLYAPAD